MQKKYFLNNLARDFERLVTYILGNLIKGMV
jgi:hypothetical protein